MTWNLSHSDMCRILHAGITQKLAQKVGFEDFLDAEGLPLQETEVGREGYPADSVDLLELVDQVVEMFHLDQYGDEDNFLRFRKIGRWAEMILDSWGQSGAEISFRTSGTTGPAKKMTHTRADLDQEINFLKTLFPDTRRVVALTPANHIYGFLFTTLLPKALGVPVQEGRHWSPKTLERNLKPGDLLISHPLYWQLLSRAVGRFPSGVRGVTSTAPCPPEIIEALKDKGLERMTEVYGASETGGMAFRHDPTAAYQLFDHWTRLNPDSLQKSRPHATKLTHPTPDNLAWLDNRRFHVVGRKDGAVQVGGINVHPQAIARKLEEHPLVAHCTVRMMDPDRGKRLEASIVPKEVPADPKALIRELHRWCGDALTAPERPGHIALEQKRHSHLVVDR